MARATGLGTGPGNADPSADGDVAADGDPSAHGDPSADGDAAADGGAAPRGGAGAPADPSAHRGTGGTGGLCAHDAHPPAGDNTADSDDLSAHRGAAASANPSAHGDAAAGGDAAACADPHPFADPAAPGDWSAHVDPSASANPPAHGDAAAGGDAAASADPSASAPSGAGDKSTFADPSTSANPSAPANPSASAAPASSPDLTASGGPIPPPAPDPGAPAVQGADAAGGGLGPLHRLARGGLARTTSIVTLAVLSSRFLGFVRDTVLSDRFGAAHLADAYITATTIPLLLFGVIGQALPTVFIPQYTRTLQAEGPERAAELANNINTTLTSLALVLMAVMWLLAPQVVDIVAPGIRVQDPAEAQLAASMVRIMVPIVVYYIWAAVMQGILNVHGHFLAPAGMGVPQNLTIIAAMIVGSLHRSDISLVAWGSMIGTSFTFLVQLPPLRRTGFRFRLRIRLSDPLLRRTVILAGPVVLASLSSQIGVTVDRLLASELPVGAISAIYYATRLQQFTYAIVGLAIATVLFPQLAEHAGAGALGRFTDVLIRGLRILSFVALPVMVGVFAFRWGIVRVIFQHGHFSPGDTARVLKALVFFTPGILTYAWMDYLMRGFFALQDTRTPMLAGVLSVGINIVLDFALVGIWQQGGLTLATSIAWGCACAYLLVALRRRVGPLGGRRVAAALGRMLAAAAIAVAPAYALFALWIDRVAGHAFVRDGVGLAVAGLLAVGLYLVAAGWLRVPELRYARELAGGAARRTTA